MKKVSTLITAVFIIMAALLGWFLPLADFNLYDQINDGRQMDLDIEQINLSYRDDLTISQKINIANYENVMLGAIELDKGIFTFSSYSFIIISFKIFLHIRNTCIF